MSTAQQTNNYPKAGTSVSFSAAGYQPDTGSYSIDKNWILFGHYFWITPPRESHAILAFELSKRLNMYKGEGINEKLNFFLSSNF